MTGRNPLRNGAWATCWGRSILRKDELTMADVFAANGYRTGMFGKWHLGDNYPYRPEDRGFQVVVAHKGGGVGQTPDFWANNYFDDTYFHNGEPLTHEGYCTDIWFDEAVRFIEENRDRPFFCYLATNAPHEPYLVADRYTVPYRGIQDIPEPAFYGMIANIDENFGRLDTKIKELGLKDDTILIFTTDNGSSGGCTLDERRFVTSGYNAKMRGKKGSYYDGGHRVPLFIRWPNGDIGGGRDVDDLIVHMDLLPTFIDLCGLEASSRDAARGASGNSSFDGMSVAALLTGQRKALPDRIVFVQYRQSTDIPQKWDNAVMAGRWRLIGGTELYDIHTDPGQRRDVAAEHPGALECLRTAHEEWWEEVSPNLDQYCPISLGNDAENPTRLNAMDVMGDVAWHQGHIVMAQKSTGKWSVDVEQEGEYRFSLRRWPEELDLPIEAAMSPEEVDRIAPYQGGGFECHTISPAQARLTLFGREETVTIEQGAKEVTINLRLRQTGVTQMEAWFIAENGETQGAYYVYVERLPDR